MSWNTECETQARKCGYIKTFAVVDLNGDLWGTSNSENVPDPELCKRLMKIINDDNPKEMSFVCNGFKYMVVTRDSDSLFAKCKEKSLIFYKLNTICVISGVDDPNPSSGNVANVEVGKIAKHYKDSGF